MRAYPQAGDPQIPQSLKYSNICEALKRIGGHGGAQSVETKRTAPKDGPAQTQYITFGEVLQ